MTVRESKIKAKDKKNRAKKDTRKRTAMNRLWGKDRKSKEERQQAGRKNEN